MSIEATDLRGYRLFSITENLGAGSDISELQNLIQLALDEGYRRFALSFRPDSYLSSRVLATIVRCFVYIEEAGGEVVLVLPSTQLKECIQLLGFTELVRIADSTDDL
ncbi:MAG: hypothetical protein GF331_10000 [Chitinivibrionales bacterium]|nr:hypothetical protein [Chitinivibrionales bacterium]